MSRSRVDFSSFRTFIVVVAAVAVMAAVMTATPSTAAPEPTALANVKPSPDKNTKKGSASEAAKTSAKARKTKERVEVKGEQTATDSVFANPDGTFSRERAAAPIRAKGSDGKLAPIDTTLEGEGSSLSPRVATGEVSFTGTGDGDLASYQVAEDASVGLGFVGDLGTPTTEGSSAAYPVAGSETETVRVAALPDGFVSHVLLSEAPAEAPTYTFTLNLDGLSAKLVNNRLELSDDKGEVVAESRPFQMWDAARDEHGDPSNVAPVDAQLVDGANGSTELRLSPSMEYLTDPATEYPVTVDPDIAKVDNKGDTYYWEGQLSSDSRGTDYRLRTGEDDGDTYRSLVTWAYEDYVGQTVTNATLKLHQYSSDDANNCQPRRSDFFPTTADTDATIVWGTRPPVETSDRFRSSKTYNHGDDDNQNCPDATESINVTPIVSAWAGGIIDSDTANNKRQGIEMRAENENSSNEEKRYCSSNLSGGGGLDCNSSTKVPVLSVTYAAELGDESFYSMTKHPLNATSSLAVNNRTGNAFVSANDASVNARGVPFALSRSYNSQAPETTSMGTGWNLGIGADVWLEKRSQYRYDYHSPDGTVFGSFVRKTANTGSPDYDNFLSPLGGVGADLDQDPADDQFILTMRDSQMKYRFTESGADGHAYLTRISDRSGNSMNLTYSGTTSTGVPKLSSVTDAGGRSYAVAYTGDFITSVTENDGLGRVWKYGYDGAYLTSYTDPDNKKTDYDYDTGFTGPDLLKSITNPANQSGQRPTTNLTYALDSGLSVDQVIKVGYVLDDTTTYEYSFEYHDDENGAAKCQQEDHGDFATEVTDPNAAKTTYCFKFRDTAGGKAKDWIYDGEGRERTNDFNADRQSEIMSEGVTGSTVATYAAATPDQLKTVKDPDSDTGRAGTRTDIDYAHSGGGDSSPKGGEYLPGSVTDPNGDCIRYEYDSEGRATASITDLRGSGTNRSCATATGGARHTFTYNGDGTVAKSTDPNSGATPTDADRTIYTYWASGDTGFVAGSVGLIKSVREPGGDCATGAGRKLCESYTYDAAGRTATVTNGKGEKTTTKYDVMDRTTGVFTGGSTACNILAGNNNCATYAYDAEGNLTTRGGSGYDSTFTYDRMNRQLKRNLPSSIEMTMSYDGVGNLTSYGQKIGSKTDEPITYAYDQGNIVASVTDAAGTIDVNADDDANIEEYIFPGSNGIKIDLDTKDNGKTESAEVLANQGSGSTLYKIGYDYTDGTVDEDQMQSRTTSSAGADLNGTIDYQYEFGRLASATDSSTAGPDYTYTHDEIGNVTSEKRASDTAFYGYDRAGQLCWRGPNDGTKLASGCPTTPNGNTTLNQDAAGNNTNTSGTNATTYNDRDQVTKLGGIDMTYRDLGNDQRGKAGSTTMAEGPLGITGTSVPGGVLQPDVITWYTRMPDGTILTSRKGTETQNYFTEPHNKSVVALYSPSGAKTATFTYSPYGETTVESGGTVADGNPFRYISGYQDTAGPEDYYKLGARYYDGHGHFTQPDPLDGEIADPRTMTAYSYGAGDPINLSDPTGRSWEEFLDALGKATGVTDTYDFISHIVHGDIQDAFSLVVGVAVGNVVSKSCGTVVILRNLLTPDNNVGQKLVGCFALGAATGAGATAGSNWVIDRLK